MKIIYHKGLNSKKWNSLNIYEQMANIGAEVGRTISWQKRDDSKYAKLAFERALELLALTILDPKNKIRLKELTRLREIFIDYFLCDNIYKSDEKFWQNYFYNFNYAARL